METWRVESLIRSFEACSNLNRRDADNCNFDPKLKGHSEGRAAAQQQAADWLRDAMAKAAAARPVKAA